MLRAYAGIILGLFSFLKFNRVRIEDKKKVEANAK